MIAGSFFLIFLFLRLPKKLTLVLTMLIVTFYVPLAGFGIPVQRAGIMALMVLTAGLIGRPAHLLNALCASFFLLLVMDPKSLWNIGFQLSFLSVLSLIVVLPFLPKHRLLSLSIGGSLAVLIGTSPVVLYYFNTFSPVGVIANLIAIPVFDAALFSTLFAMLFCWVPLLGKLLVVLSSGIVTVGLAWIHWLSAWRPGYWFFIKPEAWQLWTYYGMLGLILGVNRVRVPMKKLMLGFCLMCWTVAAVSMFRVDDADGRQGSHSSCPFFERRRLACQCGEELPVGPGGTARPPVPAAVRYQADRRDIAYGLLQKTQGRSRLGPPGYFRAADPSSGHPERAGRFSENTESFEKTDDDR